MSDLRHAFDKPIKARPLNRGFSYEADKNEEAALIDAATGKRRKAAPPKGKQPEQTSWLNDTKP